MLGSDRAEFETQLSDLCAGFNVPMGDRVEAYWRGLAKMELRTFVRVVEHCLGEEGPERIPTTRACWALSKVIRPKRSVAVEPEEPRWTGDHWDRAANHFLLDRVSKHPHRYKDPEHTRVVVRWKNTWAEDMRVATNHTEAMSRETWDECMSRADEQIAQLEQRARAA